MIKRRLVGGILLLVVAGFELLMFTGYYERASADAVIDDAVSFAKDTRLFVSYIIYAVLAIIVGIIFISTCKRQPVKWFEYTLLVVMLLAMAVIPYMAPNTGTEGGLFGFTATVQCLCYAVGAPTRKGFKNFPFKSKDDAHSEKSIDKLTKLKELLDSGAITQEEFDQEKKKIWK